MDLQEFITETLTQIVQGVEAAQKNVSSYGAEINPKLVGTVDTVSKGGGGIKTKNGNYAQMVEFDVAVTAIEGSGKKAGIGVVSGIVSLGTTGQTNNENSTTSKLRFKIPLSLPIN